MDQASYMYSDNRYLAEMATILGKPGRGQTLSSVSTTARGLSLLYVRPDYAVHYGVVLKINRWRTAAEQVIIERGKGPGRLVAAV